MMRLRSRPPPDDDLSGDDSSALRPERTGVPLKAQKLLGEKGQLGFNLEESIIISGGGTHAGGIDAPPKAQKVLGERAKVRDVRIQEARHADPDSLWHVRDAERQRSIGNSDNTSHADSDGVTGVGKGPAPPSVPMALKSSEDVRPVSNGSTIPTGTSSSWNTRHQPSNESLGREYYDPTMHTLFMSQQTSESSVPDMALRKAGMMMYDSSSETRLATPPSRHSASRKTLPDRSVSDFAPLQQKKRGLRSLLSHSRPDVRAGNGGKFARPPPSSSPASSESRGTNERGTGRPNKFGADIYDIRKTNVRRPPKGIKNWFDGFDISSEEEEPDPVELPTVESGKKKDTGPVHEALPSVFSLYGEPIRDFKSPFYTSPSALPPQKSSAGNARPGSRDQRKRKSSHGSITAESASSGVVEGRKRGGESRLAKSRLGAHSVLSLSSGSDGEVKTTPANRDSVGNSTIVNERATSFDLHRVTTAPGGTPIEEAGNDAKMRRTNSHSSGLRSNPFRDGSTNYNSTPRIPSRDTGSMLSGTSSNARRWQYGWNGQSHRSSNVQSPYERDGGESAGGETSSSVPTDASRLMAVTEEEMILLELMRQKRAAMQKHSFAEGYRLARRQGEQLHYNPAQDSAFDPSLLVLKKRSGSRMTSRGMSRTESLIREELQQRKRLSALRKEEVDKAFKIGRFLEMESPAEDEVSKLDKFLVMAPGVAEDFSGRPVSGTEIEIDSRYGDNEDGGDETQSHSDEEGPSQDHRLEEGRNPEHSQYQSGAEQVDEEVEARTPQPRLIISPMQRLTNQVRPVDREGIATMSPINQERVDAKGGAGITAESSSIERLSSNGQSRGEAPAGPDAIEAMAIPARSPGSRPVQPLQVQSYGLVTKGSDDNKIDSPDTPVATTWARPTSLKHPRPQRQPPVLDFSPLESQPLQAGQGTPSTPLFDAAPQSVETPTEDSAAAAGNPGPSYKFNGDVPSPLRSHPPGGTGSRRSRKAPVPPPIDTAEEKIVTRAPSMLRITSAGEDVLAAWAELGGGNELRWTRDR